MFWDKIYIYYKPRVKFYTQEIVFLRQDLLYKMQRSCLIPPSSAETMDSFEHVSFCFLWIIYFIIKKTLRFASTDQLNLILACSNNYSSKPPLSIAFDRTTHSLELRSLFEIVSNSWYGIKIVRNHLNIIFFKNPLQSAVCIEAEVPLCLLICFVHR